jgi:hypothetical protein
MKLQAQHLADYLHCTPVIDWETSAILEQTQAITRGLTPDTAQAQALFAWVRDAIPHAWDIGTDVVTCAVSEGRPPAALWPRGGAKKGFGFLIRKDGAMLYVPVACYGTRDEQAAAALRCGEHRAGCSILVCDAACILVTVQQYRRTVTSNEKSA